MYRGKRRRMAVADADKKSLRCWYPSPTEKLRRGLEAVYEESRAA